jgi:predicted nuclease of restriction endonuclease-like (RecB) superfamily
MEIENKGDGQFKIVPDLLSRITAKIEGSRSAVLRTVNSEMVLVYWFIGHEIVEEQQSGQERAVYSEKVIEKLSEELSKRFGKGYSIASLKSFRQFYLTFPQRIQKSYQSGSQLPRIYFPGAKQQPAGAETSISSRTGTELNPMSLLSPEKSTLEEVLTALRTVPFSPDLSWTHYRTLMRVENELSRSFYEIETEKNRWSNDELERQIASQLFERLAHGKDREAIRKLARTGEMVTIPAEAIRDPFILEFLNLPESRRLVETDFEEALITHLQEFLLELGQGFAFIGRQKRITLEGDHYYVDLVFYHAHLKCYVVVDLKTVKLTHGDLGQMQLYVNYYDREIKDENDNPTIGLILCTDKNEAMVEYLLNKGNEQIFASRYKLFLPDEKKLENEMMREVRLLTGGKID